MVFLVSLLKFRTGTQPHNGHLLKDERNVQRNQAPHAGAAARRLRADLSPSTPCEGASCGRASGATVGSGDRSLPLGSELEAGRQEQPSRRSLKSSGPWMLVMRPRPQECVGHIQAQRLRGTWRPRASLVLDPHSPTLGSAAEEGARVGEGLGQGDPRPGRLIWSQPRGFSRAPPPTVRTNLLCLSFLTCTMRTLTVTVS